MQAPLLPTLQAFARWRAEHAATARAVRAALQGGPSQEAQLRTLADEARSQLWGLFQVTLQAPEPSAVTRAYSSP